MILYRQLAVAIVVSTGLALAVLVALVSFVGVVDDMGNLGKGSYGSHEAFLYALLRIPGIGYELLPPAGLLGSLLGLGLLANHNELVAMRAAGFSIAQIVLVTLVVGSLLMAGGVYLGEVVVPVSEKWAQDLRARATREQISVRTASGYWARDGRSYINIRDIDSGGGLRGLHVYELDPSLRLHVATYAEAAEYRDGHWLLEDVEQSWFNTSGIEVRRLEQATWTSILTPELLKVVEIKPENLSAVGLYRYLRYLQENGLDARRYRLALWQKVFRPVYLLVMLFLSLPFVLGPLRTVGIGQRILVGALLGIGFSILVRAMGHVGLVYDIGPAVSSLLPALLFAAIGVVGLRQVR